MSEKKKKRERRSRKGAGDPATPEVQLVPIIQFLHENLSEALCEVVFKEVRTAERERKWSLFALARFWSAVVLKAPPSLTQLLEQATRPDPLGILPLVEASSESFFEKCKALSSEFFMALYSHFMEKVLPQAPASYAREFAQLRKKFPEIQIIDASRFDKIAHRLKILWDEERAVLPGCITAVYDLFRGIATQIWFDPDAAASEFNRAVEILPGLTEGSLVMGDRLYCSLQLFRILRENHCFGLFRRNRTISFQKIRLLWKGDVNGKPVEDWLILAGAEKEKIELRLVVLKQNGQTYEAMTSDLDPEHLSAKEIVKLYPWRWKIETYQAHCIDKRKGLKPSGRRADNPIAGTPGSCPDRSVAPGPATGFRRGIYAAMYRPIPAIVPPRPERGGWSRMRGQPGFSYRLPDASGLFAS